MPKFPKLPKIDKNPIKTASGLIREAVSGIQEAAAEIDSAVKGIDSEVRAPIEEGKPPIEEIAPVALKEAPPEQKTTPTITTQEPEKVPQGGSTGVVTRQGLHPETMTWQLQETRAELWELEGHLKHYFKECGPDFSCCFKHSQNLIDLARETKSMTTDPIWDSIIKLGEEVKLKAHPDHIHAGTYFAVFRECQHFFRTNKEINWQVKKRY